METNFIMTEEALRSMRESTKSYVEGDVKQLVITQGNIEQWLKQALDISKDDDRPKEERKAEIVNLLVQVKAFHDLIDKMLVDICDSFDILVGVKHEELHEIYNEVIAFIEEHTNK